VFTALLAEGAWTLGCSSAGVPSPLPPPPPSIAVTVAPATGSLLLGARTTFIATVTNSTDTAVSWSVSGVPGGTAALGTITSSGVYTAPADLPSPTTVQVTATSRADSTKSANASLAIISDITLSAVWSAIMFPFAPAPGTFSGLRPTAQQPDAPLGDDDRTGLQVLYPDPADALHRGSISGKISPANPLAQPLSPPAVTGVFGAQIVAVDGITGAATGAVIGGWSCVSPGPAQFDGTYEIDALAVGHSYTVYAEALNGVVDPSQISNEIDSLCRNVMTDPGWPPLQACVVPAADISFTARTRPGP
jgi:hypothetical protein